MSANLVKSVEINDREFIIKKFDAKTGLKIARLVIAKAAPLIPTLGNMADDANKGSKGKTKEQIQRENDQVFASVGQVLGALDDDDLDLLIDRCLRFCSERLPAGPTAIIDQTGHYAIPDVEYDMMLTLRLCFEAIKFGASDFFDGDSSVLKQFLK